MIHIVVQCALTEDKFMKDYIMLSCMSSLKVTYEKLFKFKFFLYKCSI